MIVKKIIDYNLFWKKPFGLRNGRLILLLHYSLTATLASRVPQDTPALPLRFCRRLSAPDLADSLRALITNVLIFQHGACLTPIYNPSIHQFSLLLYPLRVTGHTWVIFGGGGARGPPGQVASLLQQGCY